MQGDGDHSSPYPQLQAEGPLAINKRKILQSAQKYMQKGALDKALKDYATILKADPKDVNIRLKVGDIHLKQGKTDEAVSSYLKAAQQFTKDGFDSKAIALYKQVTKIDPKRYDVYLPLSELYQRLGLNSDALKALQTAADAYYRDGEKDQALDLLRKMANFDPSNTANRLRVAELLRQGGREAEALAEYHEVAEELERQGDAEGRVKVFHEILEIDPNRMETFVTLGNALVDQKNWSQAEATAETMVDTFPGEPEGYELLVGIYQHAGRDKDLPEVYRRLAEVYKERGDEDQVREIMQRFVSTEALGTEQNGDSVLGDDEGPGVDAAIGGDSTLAMEPGELTDPGAASDAGMNVGTPIGGPDRGHPANEEDSKEASGSSLPPLPPLDPEPSSEGEIDAAEGDPEQLFAEANVYLRYGKQERAIESLRAVLGQDPGHRAALEKLGEVLADTGDKENAVTAFSRAAEAARAEGDESGFQSLRAQIEALDPAAAESLAPAPTSPEAQGEAAQEPARGLEEDLEEIDIEIDSGVEEEAADEVLESDDSIDFEIEEKFGLDEVSDAAEEAAAEPGRGEEPILDFEEIEGDLGESGLSVEDAIEEPILEFQDMEGDLGDSGPIVESVEDERLEERSDLLDAGDPAGAVPDSSLEDAGAEQAFEPSQSAGSAATPQQIVEDLEEADFYLQQGLHDEAEEVYRRILETAPNHPQAMLRLGEIEAARGGPQHAPLEPGSESAVEAEASSGQTPLAPSAPEVPVAGFEPTGQEPTPSAREPQEDGASDFGMDLPDPSSLPGFEEVSEVDFDIDASEESEAEATHATPESPAPQAEQTMPLVGETTAPMDSDTEEATDTGDFDLAAELSGAFDGDESGPLSGGLGGTTEEEGFEQVFAAFKQGVEQELDEGDFETHYDLGIAYKEMGLLEDAIGEFQIALSGPARKLASLHAMGLCALELERASDGVSHFEQALALPEVPSEQQIGLHFDLGRAYEQQGDLERARTAYEVVAASDPDFGGVDERLAELECRKGRDGAEALAAKPEEETFESFDDRIENVARQLESESYESFDDLMSEHGDEADEIDGESEAPLAEAEEADGESEAPLAEAEVLSKVTEAESATEPEPEPAPDTPAPEKPSHRKKISFV